MLRFIVANSGDGKTSYAAARFGIDRMHGEYARQAQRYAKNMVKVLNSCGYNVSNPPKHLVYTYGVDIKIRSPDFGTRQSWKLDAERLGFKTDEFKPQYVFPGSTLIIDEMQEVFDSHFWQQFENNCSRWMEQCRKLGIDVIFIAQADNLGLLRIRQLCEITLVKNLQVVEDRHGNTKCTWTLETWHRHSDYLAGKNSVIEQYTFNGNIFKYFDTNEGKERFFDGLENADFDAQPHLATDLSPEGVKEYIKRYPIRLTGNKEKTA